MRSTPNIVWIGSVLLGAVLAVGCTREPLRIVVYGDSLASGGLVGALEAACRSCEVLDATQPGSWLLREPEPWAAVLPHLAGRDLVLWQGVNDLNVPGAYADEVLTALERRITEALDAGARRVVLLPYPPVRPVPGRPRDPIDVSDANAGLGELGTIPGARLALPSIPADAVDVDGLHLVDAFYPRLAAAVLTALRHAA